MANKVTKEYPLSLNIPKDCLECGFLVEENDVTHCVRENSCKELKKWIKERDEQIRTDEREKVLDEFVETLKREHYVLCCLQDEENFQYPSYLLIDDVYRHIDKVAEKMKLTK